MTIDFPMTCPIGTIYIRPENNMTASWKVLSLCQGIVEVPAGVDVKLHLRANDRILFAEQTRKVIELLSQLPGNLIQYLEIFPNLAVTDSDLAGLANLHGLIGLDLRGSKITGEAFSHLTELKHLQSIKLSASNFDCAYLPLLKNYGKLSELSLANIKLNNADFKLVCENANLKSVFLELTNVSDNSLFALTSLQKLEQVKLGGTRFNDQTTGILSKLPALKSLDIGNYEQVTDANLQNICLSLTGLHKLSIASKLTDAGMIEIGALTHLRVLEFWSNDTMSGSTLKYLSQLSELESLQFSCSKILKADFSDLSPLRKLVSLSLSSSNRLKGLSSILPGFHFLRELSLFERQSTVKDFVAISHLTELRKLDLAYWKGISHDISPLYSLSKLKSLSLMPLEIDFDLSHFHELEDLNLYTSSISDSTLETISENAPLQRINLNHSLPITDKGVLSLAQKKDLTDIRLQETLTSDIGLMALASLDKLSYIDVLSTQVTYEGIQRFLERLPCCELGP